MRATNLRMQKLQTLLKQRPFIENGTAGKYSITSKTLPAGMPIQVVSMRNSILQGKSPLSITLDTDYELHTLRGPQGTWMTDSPQEIEQMIDSYEEAEGNVLVGGLGLGVFPSLLMYNVGVESISVIERTPSIIKLNEAYLNQNIQVVRADLFKYAKRVEVGQYQFAFFDIWQGTNEMTWVSHVVPLLRLYRGKIPTIHCWQQAEMNGQLAMSLTIAVHLSRKTKLMGYQDVFRIVAQEQKAVRITDKLEWVPQLSPLAQNLLNIYLNPLHPKWEELFGSLWDKLVS